MDASEQPLPARDALLRAAREELAERGDAAVSLRAVARRAGVSHAAPAHFFGDRAGMLTAVAVEGFDLLARALAEADARAAQEGSPRLESLGHAYLDFGLTEPALMDLMFRRSELAPEDPALVRAQQATLARLGEAVADLGLDAAERWSLVSWAVVHGLVSLVREGVLGRVVDSAAAPALAHGLVTLYATGLPDSTT